MAKSEYRDEHKLKIKTGKKKNPNLKRQVK
jgi:hypothetical protein